MGNAKGFSRFIRSPSSCYYSAAVITGCECSNVYRRPIGANRSTNSNVATLFCETCCIQILKVSTTSPGGALKILFADLFKTGKAFRLTTSQAAPWEPNPELTDYYWATKTRLLARCAGAPTRRHQASETHQSDHNHRLRQRPARK